MSGWQMARSARNSMCPGPWLSPPRDALSMCGNKITGKDRLCRTCKLIKQKEKADATPDRNAS